MSFGSDLATTVSEVTVTLGNILALVPIVGSVPEPPRNDPFGRTLALAHEAPVVAGFKYGEPWLPHRRDDADVPPSPRP